MDTNPVTSTMLSRVIWLAYFTMPLLTVLSFTNSVTCVNDDDQSFTVDCQQCVDPKQGGDNLFFRFVVYIYGYETHLDGGCAVT